MKAKKKEIKKITLGDLGLSDGEIKIRYASITLPADRQACKMVSGDLAAQTKELVRLLHEEAKVI
jgi:electron transfer flavoprotein beta subunit